jgi:folate-binding protein YgfZ
MHDATCRLASYNSPKGRVLATLLLTRQGDTVLAQLPGQIAEPVRKRLAMYILRSKVKAELVTERYIKIGLGGPTAMHIIDGLGATQLKADFDVCRAQPLGREARTSIDFVLKLPGNRYQFMVASADTAIGLWNELRAAGAQVANAAAWGWLSVMSGIPEVEGPVQEQFVAQMLNLELLGGISFNKGCYPGQEIIARTQYRGEIKRRTLLAHTPAAVRPDAGTAIFATSSGHTVGAVVNAAPSPDGGHDMLICIHLDQADRRPLRLSATDGPPVELLPMPYKIPNLA